MHIETLPAIDWMQRQVDKLPAYMRPTTMPWVVICHEALTEEQVAEIRLRGFNEEPYKFPSCQSKSTRELKMRTHPELNPLADVLRNVNDAVFRYEIADLHHSWMQVYGPGNEYRWHTDGSPGQRRALTAVAILSRRDEYDGGNLVFDIGGNEEVTRLDVGTVAIFPHFVRHKVEPITWGERATINMGVWFK